jgi:biopolymer transport protein ExbD
MFEDPADECDPITDINTTPLIDVMLVLLIMLIVTIPLQTHSVRLDTPAAPAIAEQPPSVVRLGIEAGGALTWNGEPVRLGADLDARLRQAATAANPPEIHLHPDKSVAYAHVAAVMAAAQRQGVAKLGVAGAEQFLD